MYAGYILKEVLPSECHLQSAVPTGSVHAKAETPMYKS
jgi:hypothetical protein